MSTACERLRILYLAQVMPYPSRSGAQWVVLANLCYLAARHDVRLVCRAGSAASPDPIKVLRERVGCREVIEFDPDQPGDWAARSYLGDAFFRGCLTSRNLQRLLPPLCRWAEVIQVESLGLAFNLFRVLRTLRLPRRPAVVLRLHDVMSVVTAERATHDRPSTRLVRRLVPPSVRSALLRRRAGQYRRLEASIYECLDGIVVFSAEDEELVRRLAPRARVAWIPMGADPVSPVPSRGQAGGGHRTLTFVGWMGWPPNADAAIRFVRDILPRLSDLELRVLIVGEGPPPELRKYDDGSRVRVLGYVPDLEAIWQSTDVAVVPVRFGTGVKTKTLDALLHGIPVVAYPEGRRGVAVTPGVDFLEAATSEAFADSVRRLLTDPEFYRRIAENGRRAVVARHSAAAAGAQLEAFYAELRGAADEGLSPGATGLAPAKGASQGSPRDLQSG